MKIIKMLSVTLVALFFLIHTAKPFFFFGAGLPVTKKTYYTPCYTAPCHRYKHTRTYYTHPRGCHHDDYVVIKERHAPCCAPVYVEKRYIVKKRRPHFSFGIGTSDYGDGLGFGFGITTH